MKINPHRRFRKRECPSCACSIAANENRCPICGYMFPAMPRSRKKLLQGTAIVLLIVILASVLGGIFR